jgi:hypothetical protein
MQERNPFAFEHNSFALEHNSFALEQNSCPIPNSEAGSVTGHGRGPIEIHIHSRSTSM